MQESLAPFQPQDWVKKFPEVLGLAAEELSSGQKTAPSYLKSEVAYNKAIRSNPQLLGKNYDCLAEHEAWDQGSEVWLEAQWKKTLPTIIQTLPAVNLLGDF